MPKALITQPGVQIQYLETQNAKSHLSTLASFLSISPFPKQTSFVLLTFFFFKEVGWGGVKEGSKEKKVDN